MLRAIHDGPHYGQIKKKEIVSTCVAIITSKRSRTTIFCPLSVICLTSSKGIDILFKFFIPTHRSHHVIRLNIASKMNTLYCRKDENRRSKTFLSNKLCHFLPRAAIFKWNAFRTEFNSNSVGYKTNVSWIIMSFEKFWELRVCVISLY